MFPAGAFQRGRHAGLLLPLFSTPGRRSWGIGEFGDLPVLCRWMREAGLDCLLVLPLNEMAPDQHSPYSAVSALALDPIYLSMADVPEFLAIGGEGSMPPAAREQLQAARAATRIDYNSVRSLKLAALERAFAYFLEREWQRHSARAVALRAYMERERSWLHDYVLFRALREKHRGQPWWEWDAALAERDPGAMEEARQELERSCLFFAYAQWLADGQWHDARAAAAPVGVFGDLPFMVGADSADVWANQHAFRLDATVGAPPDAFSDVGQDWGLPVYRWDVFAAEDDAWIRLRAERNATLFDGFRVDHLVGFYRTYVIPKDGDARSFSPADQPSQLVQGERIMRAFLASGARVIAEDLGIVPPFVRESLRELGIAGYKVLRWEREWDAPGQPFRDPESQSSVSVATTGTHDTETLAEWWESAPEEERALVAKIPFLANRGLTFEGSKLDPGTRDVLLELLFASASDFVILPIQDIFGWRDRINVPATVTEDNWTWRLPWPVDDLLVQPQARERAETLRTWATHYNRCVLREEEDEPHAVQSHGTR
jgi:4-alpha-glucanotransferase